MSTSGRTTAIRIACVAAALALAAFVGGCGAGTTATRGSSTSVAVAPGAPTASDGGAGGTSIAGQGSAPFAGAPSASAPETAKGAATGAGTTVGAEKLIVVNKTIRLETADVQGSLTKIRELVAKANGDISSMQVSTSVDEPVYATPADASQSSDAPDSSVPLRAFVIVRVPSTGYASFIAEAAKLGRVIYQSESAEDVTQQHVDMQARLGNLTAEQSRLRQLFAKAKNVSDMLAIEQELTRVQGDIESMKAQIAYLERQAAMATVTLELTEPVAIGSPAGIDWGTSTALTDAIRAFVNTMNGLIVLLGPVLAILVFIGLPLWLVVWLVRRAAHRRSLAKAPMPAAPMVTDPAGDGTHT